MIFNLKKQIFNLVDSEKPTHIIAEEIVEICETYAIEMTNNREQDIKEMLVREDLNWLAEAIILTK